MGKYVKKKLESFKSNYCINSPRVMKEAIIASPEYI